MQRRIEHDVQSEMLGERRPYTRLVRLSRLAAGTANGDVKDPGVKSMDREQAREEQNRLVFRRIPSLAAPGVGTLAPRPFTLIMLGYVRRSPVRVSALHVQQ